jgi:hypothetical protein
LWPGPQQIDAPATAQPPSTAKAPTSAPPTRSASVAPLPRLKTRPAPPLLRARRDLLLAAIRARADSLRPCVPRDMAELDVPVRLRLARAGAVKGLEFTGTPPAHAVAECLRREAAGWSFPTARSSCAAWPRR